MSQFALSWDAYKNNICQGLCSLQQNGEFVDMTIAADGHYVKVHQLIMSLVSPYIKDLIASATNCPHPIIFLNKVSYPTLVSILEYVYTGEVRVTREALPKLLDAAKELRIKGLEDMKVEVKLDGETSFSEVNDSQSSTTKYSGANIQLAKISTPVTKTSYKRDTSRESHDVLESNQLDDFHNEQSDGMDTDYANDAITTSAVSVKSTQDSSINPGVQYTISNQGALQMILNRFMYYLRYTSRKGSSGHRRWLCINNAMKKGHEKRCSASVITQGNVVIKRLSAHNHPFHDQKILKKVRDNAVYTAIDEAESFGQLKKYNREQLDKK